MLFRSAVFAMLADKDIAGVAALLCPQVTRWYAAGLSGARGVSADVMVTRLQAAGAKDVEASATVQEALCKARDTALADDKILVFGSFHTVAEAMAVLARR